MKTIIYVKVQINSEDNLPEAKGVYIFGWDKSRTVIKPGVYMMPYDPDDYREPKKDLSEYDYWLKPVELPDEEEIKKLSDSGRAIDLNCEYLKGIREGINWILNQINQ